jgi:cytochrome c556
LKARSAAEQQDADLLFAAGGEVYSVCKACHNRYIKEMAE